MKKQSLCFFDVKHLLKDMALGHISIGHDSIPLQTKAKNLEVFFDHNLSMEPQINNVCKLIYLELRRLGALAKYLDEISKKTLASSFILSRLDYCNSLYLNLSNEAIDKLQRCQNNAARIVTRKRKTDPITPILKHLHWLPVKKRIHYKASLLCHKCIQGTAPRYISDLVPLYIPSRCLRSSEKRLLKEKTFKKKKFGSRSFSVAAPKLWNNLPQDLRDIGLEDAFKKQLKTHMFLQ